MKNKILLVESDVASRENMEIVLKEQGYQVTSVENGLKAICMVKLNLPDLVLCKKELPDMDGYQLFSSIFAPLYFNNIPFVYITSKIPGAHGESTTCLSIENFPMGHCRNTGLIECLNKVLPLNKAS